MGTGSQLHRCSLAWRQILNGLSLVISNTGDDQ